MTVGTRVRWITQVGTVRTGTIVELVPKHTFPRSDVLATKFRPTPSVIVELTERNKYGHRRLAWPPSRLLHTMEVIA